MDNRDHQLHQVQMECEEVKQEKKQSSITASDMDRAINTLKKVSGWTCKRGNVCHMVC